MFLPAATAAPAVEITASMRFDSPAVKKAVDKRNRKALGYWGGWVRKTARRSFRKRGRARRRTPPKRYTPTGRLSKAWLRWRRESRERPSSPPGLPPHTHGGRRNLPNLIAYGYDRGRKSAVVGARPRAGKIAALHEGGGAVPMALIEIDEGDAVVRFTTPARGRYARRTRHKKRTFTARYPARPFMAPAARKANRRLDRFWAASIT